MNKTIRSLNINDLLCTTTLKVPVVNELPPAEPGKAGNIIYDRETNSFYVHTEFEWQIVAGTLDDLMDVRITDPQPGEYLCFDGTEWVNGIVDTIRDPDRTTSMTTTEAGVDIIRGIAANGFFVTGTSLAGTIPIEGAGNRMMYYPLKAAFRTGIVTGTEWDNANVGVGSFASGQDTIASGAQSHASGQDTIASGPQSHAEGSSTTSSATATHAEGNNCTASGNTAHAEGTSCIASNLAAHAEGSMTTSSGIASHSEGNGTIASGAASHAEGASTVASGGSNHAEGADCTASSIGAHAEGDETLASGLRSHAEGHLTTASGTASHAEGNQSIASSSPSHAEGSLTIASGNESHAEGASTTASGSASHAEGTTTIASALAAHAEGDDTLASGAASHAEGSLTTSSGLLGSHAEGVGTTASGQASHSEGNNTTAIGTASHAEGAVTMAAGNQSHAEGLDTTADGDGSHSGGNITRAKEDQSFVHGVGLEINNLAATINIRGRGAFGRYNSDSISFSPPQVRLLTVGVGTDDGTRENGFSVSADAPNGTTNCSITGTFFTSGADFAEMFESYDGQKIPIGTTVVLHQNSGKIKQASLKTDADSTILGVITTESSVIGNTGVEKWVHKLVRDKYNKVLFEQVPVEYEEEVYETTTEEYTKETITYNEELERWELHTTTEEREIKTPVYESREIYDPDPETEQIIKTIKVPKTITVTKMERRPIINPEYDPTISYLDRLSRPEWNIVGLLGQVTITKGQPTRDTWYKMYDIDESCERWMIR